MQEQQNALLSAILPLLPLAQGIVPQLEILKGCIQEVNSTVFSTVATLKQDVISSLASQYTSRKRRLSVQSTNLSPMASTKIRIESSLPPSSTEGDDKRAKAQNTIPTAPKRADSSSASAFKESKATPRKVVRQRSIFATPHQKLQSPQEFPVPSTRANSIRSSPLCPNHAQLSRTPSMQHPLLSPKPSTPLTSDGSRRHLTGTISQHPIKIPFSSKMLKSAENVTHDPALASAHPQLPTVDVRNPSLPPDPQPPPPVPLPLQGTPSNGQRPKSLSVSRTPFVPGFHKPILMTMGSFIPGNKLRDRRSPPVSC